MEYPYFKGLEADQYSFYRVPKALVKADLFQKMSGDAKLLYAVLLDRMSLSIKNGWQDKHGNAYIICTIEEVMDSIHCARQKAVKLLEEDEIKLDGLTASGREKAVHLLSKPTEMEQLSCSAWTRKNRVVLRGTTLLQLVTQKTGKLCESLFVNH